MVLHNGRPNLAPADLARVLTPTLLLVGGDEEPEISQNRPLLDQLGAADKHFVLVPIACQGPITLVVWRRWPDWRRSGSPRTPSR